MKKKSRKILLIGLISIVFFSFFSKKILAVPEGFDWRDHLDYYTLPEEYNTRSEEEFVPTSGNIVEVEKDGEKTDYLTAMYCNAPAGTHIAFAWPLGEDGKPTGQPQRGPIHMQDWSKTHCTEYDKIKNGTAKPRDGATYATEIWRNEEDMKVDGITIEERAKLLEEKYGGGGGDGGGDGGGSAMNVASGGWGWTPEQGFSFPGGSTKKKYTSIVEYIDVIYKLLVYVVGVFGVVMFMVGGFQYLTAAGNTSLTSEAKKTMFAALVGVIIIVSAYLLLRIINIELVNLVDPKGGGGGGGAESGAKNESPQKQAENPENQNAEPEKTLEDDQYGDPEYPTEVDMGGGSYIPSRSQDPNIPETSM
ncbi:MAG: hypothetical protein GF335_04275 [Candidatus Moranbacteria bacterium]|nr:hypothetical protein [Candidatus Moranbacteria bacterium]